MTKYEKNRKSMTLDDITEVPGNVSLPTVEIVLADGIGVANYDLKEPLPINGGHLKKGQLATDLYLLNPTWASPLRRKVSRQRQQRGLRTPTWLVNSSDKSRLPEWPSVVVSSIPV